LNSALKAGLVLASELIRWGLQACGPQGGLEVEEVVEKASVELRAVVSWVGLALASLQPSIKYISVIYISLL
jgi:hypothetical protein